LPQYLPHHGAGQHYSWRGVAVPIAVNRHRIPVPANAIKFDWAALLPTISPTTLPFIMNGVITGTCTVSGFWNISRAEILGEYGAYAEVEIDATFFPTVSQCSYF
jgi:hypothetical protein